MDVRAGAVAGRFYEADREKCRENIEQMLQHTHLDQDLPDRIVAGIVPHAGWMFSGALACMVFEAIRRQNEVVDTFVLFGAIHTIPAGCGLIYENGRWETPLGDVEVDEALSRSILDGSDGLIRKDRDGHRREHSIEVQTPIIRHIFEQAKIVPILVPPIRQAHRIGEAVGRAVAASEGRVVMIGSTDLTHYGPSYRFTPMGVGPEANRWAKEKNDRFFIDLALTMQADKLVETAEMYGSACGAGAVAATVAAAKTLGAEKGLLLAHTTSAEVLADQFEQMSEDSVGYGAIVF